MLVHFTTICCFSTIGGAINTHLERQNKLFSILYHVHLPSSPKDVVEVANGWTLEEHKADFTDGLLPKEEAFTPFYESHLEEAIALFRLFFYAKDWDTFYKTLAWARLNVNSQMLVYALFLAVDRREVETMKNNFDSSQVETRSKHDLELLEHDPDKRKFHKEKAPNNINITGQDLNKISSVFEYPFGGTHLVHLYKDVGVNAMYYYFNIRYPLWMRNIIEGNADSPNQPFYGSLMYHARHLLGYPLRGYGDGPFPPCAIEQLEISLSDPLFWRLIKKIVNLYQRYLYHLPPYTLEDLVVAGVKIESVDIGRLIKNTELFELDLINTFNHTESEKFGDFQIHLHQLRPTPDNFSYKIHVQSETDTELRFKVFIGPAVNYRMTPVTLSKHRMDMFHLDTFTYQLKEGRNTIERNITDSPYFASDERSFSDMYREILSAVAGNTTYKLETFDPSNTYAWPIRLFVAAFQENAADEEPLSMLYPFDRPIKKEKMFLKVPNFYSHIVSVEPDRCSGFLDRTGCNTTNDKQTFHLEKRVTCFVPLADK
nr:unnamed protein product [Callosobruchus chinensis]